MTCLGFPDANSSHRRDPYRRALENLQEKTPEACEASRSCCQEEEDAVQREESLARTLQQVPYSYIF